MILLILQSLYRQSQITEGQLLVVVLIKTEHKLRYQLLQIQDGLFLIGRKMEQ